MVEPIEDLVSERITVSVPQLTLAAVTRRNRHYQWTARAARDVDAAVPIGQPGM